MTRTKRKTAPVIPINGAPAAVPPATGAPAATAPPQQQPDPILSALTPDDYAALKDDYSELVFFGLAHAMIPYGKAAGFVNLTGATIYNEGQKDAAGNLIGDPTVARSSLLPFQREMVILTVLATTQRDPLTMAAHIYWALMSGMTVENVADVFMTTGFYAGIDNLRFTSRLLKDTLDLLHSFVSFKKTGTKEVLGLLRAAFTENAVAKGQAAAALLPPSA